MQVQALQGYFDNGIFYQQGHKVQLPERQLVIVNVLDVPVDINEVKNADIRFWREFDKLVKDVVDEDKIGGLQIREEWLKRLHAAVSFSLDEEFPDIQRSQLMRDPLNLKD